ncbi:hypothetical protein SAMN04487972_108149 [Paracoccus halophilus]|uniref:Uncharacterized protein n=1 Tax=Paracoccus halophilus TaxID=376733 RepID=A0A099F2D7_9RHOB|nr:hypothetical protein [Paracoccus halophilus]KGJ04855.1 hypothetical protein IT41_09345 [Paracoccus halophilus]SFA51524.1 hypothetical protein SAMN04487972_108149 [Paracoccus halophilus]
MSDFESLGLKGGIWQGVIARAEPPGRLSLVHLGERIAEVLATPEGAGQWRIASAIPSGRLSDGVQTFLLLEDRGEGAAPLQPGARQLGKLTLAAGALLDDDLLAELDLMRSELDLVKRELRRLAAG